MNDKLPGRKLMEISPEQAYSILMNDYLNMIYRIKPVYDQFNVVTPGYSDLMANGTWRLQDPENYILVTNSAVTLLAARRLRGIIQSGKTIILPVHAEFTDFEANYFRRLNELPEFLNNFFGTNLKGFEV